jgi:hypothetical protein
MTAHLQRAGGAVVAGLLLLPIGGAAVAATPGTAVHPVTPALAPAPAPEDGDADRLPAPVVPAGVEIVSLRLRAETTPVVHPWHTSGRYEVTVRVLDVIGVDPDEGEHAGMVGEVHLAYALNGPATVGFVPDADGTVRISGLVEGVNRVGVQATYVNSAGPGLTASANYVAEIQVQDRATTVTTVREGAVPPGPATRPGEQVGVDAPPGTFGPGEQITPVVVGPDGQVLTGTPVVAGPDGSVGAGYTVPEGTGPGELLLYLEGPGGPGPALRVQVAERPAVVDVPPATGPGGAGVVEGTGPGAGDVDPQVGHVEPAPDPDPAPVDRAASAARAPGSLAATGSATTPVLTAAAASVLLGTALHRLVRRRA